MFEREVQVVARDGDEILVEAQRTSACSHCNANSACDTPVFGKWLQKKSRIRLPNRFDLDSGERVVIGIDESQLVKYSFIAYIVPLLSMLSVTGLASLYTESQGAISLSGLFGLLAGFLIIRSASGNQCPVVPLRKATGFNFVNSGDMQEQVND